jgi:hypothetical protein
MFGSKYTLVFILVLLLSHNVEAISKRQNKSRSNLPTPFFVSTTVSHWTENGEISDSVESYQLNISNVGFGLGLGYAFSLPTFSLMLQGQLMLGQSNIGFNPGEAPPGVLLEAQNISSLGIRADFSFLARLAEGVAIGFGFPLMKTFFLTGKVGGDFNMQRSQAIAWGGFVNMRLRKNAFVFSPKVGFLNDWKHYFASLDFQFHFY